jgi:dynein heavy chain, axonemal
MPAVFWISGFYFTQSFITGTIITSYLIQGMLQNYARKYGIPIDLLEIDCTVLAQTPVTPPLDGVYIRGMYLEGARWDSETSALVEATPKKLYDLMPVIWLMPRKSVADGEGVGEGEKYLCPVYRTGARRGTLSTTGHSTNFVTSLGLPCGGDARHWVSRGAALLLALSE